MMHQCSKLTFPAIMQQFFRQYNGTEMHRAKQFSFIAHSHCILTSDMQAADSGIKEQRKYSNFSVISFPRDEVVTKKYNAAGALFTAAGSKESPNCITPCTEACPT